MSDLLQKSLELLHKTLQLPLWAVYLLVLVELAILVLCALLLLRYAKFAGYMVRNARRNALRSFLTVASIAISLFLMITLFSLLAMIGDTAANLRDSRRLVVLNAQGFDQPLPIALVNQVKAMPGVEAASSLSWYGGSYNNERMPFAQFGIDADTIFKIYNEFKVPPDQLDAFQKDRAGTCIGRKLAADRHLKVGDPLPLQGTIYPFNLDLTIRAIYDGPDDMDLRSCWFHWDYLEEGLKRDFQGRQAGNAGAIVLKCTDQAHVKSLIQEIDQTTSNSESPTRTQTEEAFVQMFLEMFGDIRGLIGYVGLAVVFSLICVAGNAMAMSLRERTTEVAVLKAIGFPKPLVISLVLAEAILVAGLGGLIGVLGTKLFFDFVDIGRYTAQFAPVFYVPWTVAIFGMGVALLVGFVSGLFPALRAARLSIIDGLRKVG